MAEHQSRDQRGPENSRKRCEIMGELLNSADEPPLAGQLDEHLDDVALHSIAGIGEGRSVNVTN
jgi:hypothetical protein